MINNLLSLNLLKKEEKTARCDFTPFLSIPFFKFWDHFFPLLFPKDSEALKILDFQLWEVGEKVVWTVTQNLDLIDLMINDLSSPNLWKKKLFFCEAMLHTLLVFFFILRLLLSITFPQGFLISKNIGHPISGSGGKKTFKRYLKSEQKNRHTDISS